ncbi:MAG: ester cyclase [Acidimicrobiia bacterium]|nr:ester cyclase [bacterium]MXX00308.1 ester cyclase [Acidimicrobiia bacterium]MDE0674450.1 ester cyclase [bacterium]MXX45165.1 ester cyclase [Acidimicrobiia bacterium]MXY74167.1 ester cyclase [Acidimicrobiia bacterium]
MPVILPDANPDGDTEETRRVFVEFMVGQERDFPYPPDDSWKGRMRALVEEYCDPDIVIRNVPVRSPGRDGYADFLVALGMAYPDGQTSFNLIAADGDTVASKWTFRATQQSAHFEHGAAGQKIEIDGMSFARVRGGKLVEYYSLADKLAWAKQLGIVDQSVEL